MTIRFRHLAFACACSILLLVAAIYANGRYLLENIGKPITLSLCVTAVLTGSAIYALLVVIAAIGKLLRT